jgi:PAS domain S-box-containing protein
MEINSELLKINKELKAEIARHRETTRLLTEKQQFLSNVLTNAPIVIWCIDTEGIFTYSQFAGENALPDSERIGKSAIEIYKGTEVAPFLGKVIKDEVQNEILTVHGVVYDTRISPLFDANGNKTGYMGVSMDITERIKAERELEKFRLVLDQAPGAVFIMDKNWNFEYINPYFTQLSGYSSDDLLHKNISKTLYKDYENVPESRKGVTSALIEGKNWRGELLTINKNGSRYWANTIAAPFKNRNGEIDGYVVIQQDITERNRMQEALEKSEKKYKTLVENSLEGITIIRDNQILFANDTYCKMLGYTRDELYNMPSVNTLHPEDRVKAFEIAQRRNNRDFSTIHEVFRMLTKTGEIKECETTSTLIEFDGQWASFFTSHDITENKNIQRALLESEKKYRELTEMLPQTVYELDTQGNIIYFNQTGFKQFGLENSDIGKSSFNFIHPTQHDLMRENMRKTITEKTNSFGNKYTAVRKNGETFPAMTFASPIIFEDKVIGIRGLILDISEPEAMGKALRESEKRYRELAELLPQTVYEHDMDGKLTYLNQAGKKTFGIESLETGVSANDLVVAEDIERMLNNMQKSSFGNTTSRGNSYTAMRLNGEKFPVMIFATPMISEEKITGIRGIVIDMTEYMAMEKALRESERKYRALIDKATDGILITQSGVFKFVNPAFCEMMQYTEKELINKPFIEVVDKEHHAEMLENHIRRMTGASFPAIYRAKLYRKDGSSIMVELNSRTTDFEGNPASFVITRDITDRLQTEEELRKAKKELEHLNQNLEIRVHESTLKLTEANTQLIRLQKENLQSQFEVLRQQVNPHFLFNSLNVLTSLIKLEPDLAEQFTEHLSKVYRYVLENKDNDLVSLQTELDFLDAYIFLLNIRFMDKIIVKVDISEQKRECQILPLALQLLIENAIKHNAMSKRNPLKIDIFINDENVLHVENNLHKRESHMASTGVGLRNITHRYHLLEMPEPEFLKTDSKFVARIPLKC